MDFQDYSGGNSAFTKTLKQLKADPAVAAALSAYRVDRNPKTLHVLRSALNEAGITVPAHRERLIKSMTTKPGRKKENDDD